MAEDIAEFFGLRSVEAVANAIKAVVAVVGLVIFLLFFALAPIHALIFTGLLTMLGALAFKVEASIRRLALLIGAALIAVGIAALVIPSFLSTLLVWAKQLRTLTSL